MSTQNAISTATIKTDGTLDFPKNFSALSEKKQKQVILDKCQDTIVEMTGHLQRARDAREKAKKLAADIARSIEGKQLAALKAEAADGKKTADVLINQFAGMLSLAQAMGFNVSEELKNMQALDA